MVAAMEKGASAMDLGTAPSTAPSSPEMAHWSMVEYQEYQRVKTHYGEERPSRIRTSRIRTSRAVGGAERR